jgi:uncharacterized protein YbjT (DUF2867 family)
VNESPVTSVAIAGASGYVGRALVAALVPDHRVIALSRGVSADPEPEEGQPGLCQRRCDLFSLRQLTQALRGADVAVYLVHSMLPSARLTQASFEDLDLILADNFARAAKQAGVKKIIYLGGILPTSGPLSPHLRSRLEVEETLSAYGVPVIALRAGLVVGPQGSSFLILQRLVERLPAMVLPAWTKSRTQPIALSDVVQLIRMTVIQHEPQTTHYDIAGQEVLTYKEMIAQVAAALGKRSPLIPVRWFSPQLSCLWVSLVSGQPYALVSPLVESLLHEMLPADSRLMDRFGFSPTPWSEALKEALAHPKDSAPSRQERSARKKQQNESLVRSVQRLPRPKGASAREVALSYIKWLPAALAPLVQVEKNGATIAFRLRVVSLPFLILRHSSDGSVPERELFHVIGGALAAETQVPGRLEFRLTPDGESVLAAVHEFKPRLPWYLYRSTQAWLHLGVMRAFGRFLQSPKFER